jgi:hypothetical protein
MHDEEHPSPEIVLKSSQVSVPLSSPSPQILIHMLGFDFEQVKPG